MGNHTAGKFLKSVLLLIVAYSSPTAPAPRAAAETAAAVTESVCEGPDGGRLLHVPSPDWRDQVVYMMFIDRFNDGDSSNNDMGAGEFQADSPSHFNGGDLRGIIDKLPYLQDLGATAVWVTPPVLNQWWSTPYAAAGWHGYWAVNFKEVDPHFGTLETYQELSHELHCRGMSLIQDIVANHVGNFYAWDGEYKPDDPAENFYLIEEGHTDQVAPTQFPFDRIDVRDPEHREVNAYHWTPELNDYNDPYQTNYFGFGLLADINTENPVVIDAFKDSYRYWIEEVGVDAYRIDTVIYVNLPFWHHLHHDEDGIYPSAVATGRDHFLTFGEVLVPSEPFRTDGEEKIAHYFGTEEQPGLNSMLGFPLYFSMRRVLSEGQPAAQLAYRLEQHMAQYPNPYVIPTFIDNHDTARFLATGGEDAFRQALALIFTIPGMPVIYQGTDQALIETRQSMFDGGWLGGPGIFDPGSEPFRLIRQLAALRTNDRLFTRGSLEVIAGEKLHAGLLAYRREYGGEIALVLMNTADHSILVNRLDTGVGPNRSLEPVFTLRFDAEVSSGPDGLLDLELPARAVLVLRPAGYADATGGKPSGAVIRFDHSPGNKPLENDFVLTGKIGAPGAELLLIVSGNLDKAQPFRADGEGRWQVTLPVRDLGESSHYLQVYAPAHNTLSERIAYSTRVTQPVIDVSAEDPPDDAHGPTGSYIIQQHSNSGQQREILAARVRAAGANLELQLTMQELTDAWVPTNGFDNVAFTTFFSFPGRPGARALPLINTEMPGGLTWDLAHVGSGWVSYTYTSEDASDHRQGAKLGISPTLSVDREAGTVIFFFEGAKLGVDDWSGARIYVTTWDLTGEGSYVLLQQEPAQWYFGGAEASSPLIMDDLLIALPETDQAP